MSSENYNPYFKVDFYVLNEDYQFVRYEDAGHDLATTWRHYHNQLHKKYQQLSVGKKNIAELNPRIRVLFLEIKKLDGRRMLDELARTELKAPLSDLSPLISICDADIMSLWSYPYEDEIKSESAKMIRNSALDPRYKFLDSSIWFRFLPIDAVMSDKVGQQMGVSEVDFKTRFSRLVKEICEYWKKGLYVTNAAVAARELQLRLLLESKLSKEVGKGGHAEAVTPFKFHSESFLQNRASQELEFFKKERGKNHMNDAVSISSECKLRVLIVDDQGEVLSTIDDRKNANKIKAVGKKDLILDPLSDIFVNMTKEEAVFPTQGSGIIEFCLEKLEKNSFDLIFLDYLLGARKDDPSTREYGHEFLLNLLNDSKAKTSNYKRSFQGKFWIFSISSFPFALPDKLHQLGISHLQNLWHLSYGGDPVTTPHLYKYYLLRFVKQKVSSYFLHPDLLLRILKENPIEIKKGNEKFWAEYLENTINNWQRHIDLASKYAQSSQQSTFVDNIAWFCKQNFALNYILDTILGITALFREGYIGGRKILRYVRELQRAELLDYEKVANLLEEDLKKFEDIYRKSQASKIKRGADEYKLNLSNLKLYSIPKSLINKKKTLRELYLDNNQFENFPRDLFEFVNLNRLHLNNNPIQYIEGDINAFPLLTELNLSDTPIAEFLKRSHARSRSEVLELWRDIQSLQVSHIVPKVLYFGLSPSDHAQLRIDKEFKAIKTALKGESFELVPNFAIDYIEFQREILRENANVIHFGGHGNVDSLVFQDKTVPFSEVIKDFFEIPEVHAYIQCIVLNACHSDSQAKDLSKFGLYVVGIDGVVEDDYAIEFSSGFYNATTFIVKNDFRTAFRIGINAAKNIAASKDFEENKSDKKSLNSTFRDTGGFERKIINNIKLWYNGEEIKIEGEKGT